ncbi:unnamed protein product [Larinioides sclopetarius]|uniref:Uncharacterized protein n=1 Tax=Larinioides sclopetarius TaxID=280406 RepID=A0AAV1ZJ37_9ARAC
MMESLLRKSYGFTDRKASERVTSEMFEDKRSANCNICRNFSNIFDRSHRLSTSHQNKLTERFKIIRSKMKMIRYDSIAVHDDQWGSQEDFWCYFCDKSLKKHQVYEGCTIEYLGYLHHLTDSEHIKAVKSYLKYHGRKDKFEMFCKKKADLEKFLNKIPDAKNKYLAKMNFIHQKAPMTVNSHETSSSGNEGCSQASTLPQNISRKRNANLNLKPKICPWLMKSEKECNDEEEGSEKPVYIIGPTIDTLKKHVAEQKKKMLPIKRLGANFQRKQVYSSNWLPSFSGVWNKGRHRQMKFTGKHTR